MSWRVLRTTKKRRRLSRFPPVSPLRIAAWKMCLAVNPATGEFNFAVQEGYLVRDGKIVSPVRGASLIGKGNQILMRIDRVGKHMTMGQGMCGSLSGSVPTNVGQPTIRVSSLTVGGK